MSDPRPDDLVILTHAAGEFEAQAKIIVLAEAGIDAAVFPGEAAWLGTASFQQQRRGVPIWVRAEDRERAAAALERQIADSVDIDWDEVEVGEPDAETRQVAEGGSLGRLLLILPVVLAIAAAVVLLRLAVT
ncbi:MAG: hypothetical protein HRU76_04505 [Phycisphaeraceae bacterium]|nr:hypothetical protein [Phycisphaerales bacterium]QOJ16894.1 MAG: hypothetical protein HRU76_04505 [Phycisphaeraceae bacterium]